MGGARMKRAVELVLPDAACRRVEGRGHFDPLVVVVSEAPSEEEARAGVPYSGKAGTLVRAELQLAGVDPEATYLTYAVKCHLPKDRTPTPEEVAAWSPELREEVEVARPLHVVLLGKTAQKAWDLIEGDLPVGYWQVHRIPHPNAALRDRKKMGAWQDAVRRIGRAVNGETEEEVTVAEPEPWEEGEPDYGARWLAADTEYRLLNDGGSDDALVCVQVSDGARARLYRWDDIPRVREMLRGAHVYAHNIKADARHLGVDLYNLDGWDDTGLMAYLLRYPRVGLKTIGPELTGIPMLPISDILTGYDETPKRMKLTKRGLPASTANSVVTLDPLDPAYYIRTTRKKRKRDFGEALEEDYEAAKDYALRDPVVTSRLAEILEPKLRADPPLWNYYQTLEKPIVPILEKMERTGVMIDADALEPLRETLERQIEEHEGMVRLLTGQPDLNINSPDKLARALTDLGLVLVRETKSGAVSVAEDALLAAIDEIDLEKVDDETDDPKKLAVVHVLRAREANKLRKTYVERLLADRDERGRIHAAFNQMVADTNRFSSSGPNLQNIPVRGRVGSAIRRAFRAGPGMALVKTDFSALEVRIFAHLTQDEAMIRAFEQGISPHDLNAERFKVPRSKIKNWYFAVIYGAEPLKAALTAGVTIEEAWAMMRLVRQESPALVSWPTHIQNLLIDQGYVETIFGWRNYYPHFMSPIKSESAAALREAANMPVQGSASGIVKKFMIEQDKIAREMGGTIVLQVHDETVVEVPQDMVQEFALATVHVVDGLGGMGVGFSVPLDVEVKYGTNWGAMTTMYKEGDWYL
jgi:uracil-DNA glycosylase family 4